MEYPKIETLFDRDPQTHKVMEDQIRNPVFRLINRWRFTEKIDGMNMRVEWDPSNPKNQMWFAGKTDSAQIPKPLQTWMENHITFIKIGHIFPDSKVTIYGEGYGAGIQSGGNYSSEQKFSVFDILVNEKWWLIQENIWDVCKKLDLDPVPYMGTYDLLDAVDMIRRGIPSSLAGQNGVTMNAEGMVGRTEEPLFDKKGHRLIIKLKTKDF